MVTNTTCGDYSMKTREEYIKDEAEKEKIKSEERKVKWTQEILEEIKGWSIKKLEERIVKLRLSKISYYNPVSMGTAWKYFHDKCRFCGLKYIEGKHDDCCDDCWNENKSKTLEELE